jgi:hypothetical protein
MRTTLSLDDDVATKLKAEVRRSGKPLKVVANECLRAGLVRRRAAQSHDAFRVNARDLGGLRPGLSLDNIGELLDHVEGPARR